MIRFLVLPLAVRPERQNIVVPGSREPDGGMIQTERVREAVRNGFTDEASAIRYAEGAAAEKPGTTFMIYEAHRAVEVPSGPLQYKRLNDSGELVNA